MKLLSADQLPLIETHLRELLERIFHGDGLSSVNRVIRDYVLGGGKRLRPQLCVWTFVRCATQAAPALPSALCPLPRAVMDLACSWELFHAFLLAHDDIIDNADLRRDGPSLHRRLATLDGNCGQFGTSLGIVAGDLLFSGAMRIWHELDLPSDVYRQELRLFSRIACLTGFGQAIDICHSHAPLDDVSEELLLREYHWKTAAYTFEGPMLSGAILAGVDEAAHEPISRFALALGQAYQLQNDLLDLRQVAHDGCDLVQGKRTITLLRARAGLPESKRADFDRRLRELREGNGQTTALAEDLRKELRETGAAEQTECLIDRFLEEARGFASDSKLPPSLRSALGDLLNSLKGQYFVAPTGGAS